MAINPMGTLPLELYEEQQALNRQQRMAQALMQQGQQMPQGQMVSGRFVPTSFFQNITPLVQSYVGSRMAEKADKQALDLAKQLRQRYGDELKEFRNLMQGREVMGAEQAGPMLDAQGQAMAIPREMTRTAPNVQGAYDFAASASNPALQQVGLKKLTEGPESFTLTEGAKRFVTMPDGSVKEVASGGQKPRSPVSVGNYLIDPESGRVIFQAPEKPTAGQVVERDDGTFLINTRTGQATPVMGAGGQPLMGGGKPLTETQGNAVAFGARATQANQIITDLENKGIKNTGLIRSTIASTVGATPFIGDRLENSANAILNVTASPEQQQTKQARQNFITAVLRKESGAAIQPSEFRVEEEKYFPTINDDAKTIKQKQEARKLAIEALKAQAGPSGVRQINQITGQTQNGGGNVVDFNSLPTGR
jgi:hypothetical protein